MYKINNLILQIYKINHNIKINLNIKTLHNNKICQINNSNLNINNNKIISNKINKNKIVPIKINSYKSFQIFKYKIIYSKQ